MLEIILSVVAVLVFVVVLFLILITPSREHNSIGKLFAAPCTNSCEDADDVIKRAVDGKIIELDFLGQKTNE